MTVDHFRRRSPWWVRSMTSQALHGLAGRLQRIEYRGVDPLSGGQDWLLDAAISELTWRSKQARRSRRPSCTCHFCFEDESPFG